MSTNDITFTISPRSNGGLAYNLLIPTLDGSAPKAMPVAVLRDDYWRTIARGQQIYLRPATEAEVALFTLEQLGYSAMHPAHQLYMEDRDGDATVAAEFRWTSSRFNGVQREFYPARMMVRPF